MYDAIIDKYTTKRAEIKTREYQEKLRKPKVYAVYTAEQMLVEVVRRGEEVIPPSADDEGFKLSGKDLEIYKTLCLYFTNDKRFEKRGEGFSLKKGLLLQGPVGCGKTLAMKLFQSNQKQTYTVVSCRSISYEYKKYGVEGIEPYFKTVPVVPSEYNFGQKEVSFSYDDLGVEDVVKNFGNATEVMADIILTRHELESTQPTFRSHITTNLGEDDINDRYGNRMWDRFIEMYNFIEFPHDAKSKRK